MRDLELIKNELESNKELRREVAEAIYKMLFKAEYHLEGTYSVYVSVKDGNVIISNTANENNYCVVSFDSKEESIVSEYIREGIDFSEEVLDKYIRDNYFAYYDIDLFLENIA